MLEHSLYYFVLHLYPVKTLVSPSPESLSSDAHPQPYSTLATKIPGTIPAKSERMFRAHHLSRTKDLCTATGDCIRYLVRHVIHIDLT